MKQETRKALSDFIDQNLDTIIADVHEEFSLNNYSYHDVMESVIDEIHKYVEDTHKAEVAQIYTMSVGNINAWIDTHDGAVEAIIERFKACNKKGCLLDPSVVLDEIMWADFIFGFNFKRKIESELKDILH